MCYNCAQKIEGQAFLDVPGTSADAEVHCDFVQWKTQKAYLEIRIISRYNICEWKQLSPWDKAKMGSITTTYLLLQLAAIKYVSVLYYCFQ